MNLGKLHGKIVWQTFDQGPLDKEGAPLMVSDAIAVALSWMHIITFCRCLMIQVPVPEVHKKTTKINGLTLQQPFLE